MSAKLFSHVASWMRAAWLASKVGDSPGVSEHTRVGEHTRLATTSMCSRRRPSGGHHLGSAGHASAPPDSDRLPVEARRAERVPWRAASSSIGVALIACAAIALPLAGCDTRAGLGTAPAASLPFTTTSGSPSFLEKIPEAPMNTAYGGVRRVYFDYSVNDVPVTIDYTERVISDGHGQFTVIPLQVTQPAMSAQAQDLFKLLQMHREGFLYRHRDFRIRDLALFEQNYSVTDLGSPVTVCGRSCAWLEIRRLSGGQSYHRVAVDLANGLILRGEEFANAGQLEARVEFTEFTLTPDFAGVEFHAEQLAPHALDLNSDTAAQIGFEVHAPTLLPAAYQLEKSEMIDDGTQEWARLTYGDGAEQIFFLDSVNLDAGGSSQNPTNPGNQPGAPKRTVHVFHFGPWIVAQGTIHSRRLIAVGKTDESALLRMLQSALR